ncbi:MAG: hypothetical protein AAF797_00200 [Planctomycetota bacterium]
MTTLAQSPDAACPDFPGPADQPPQGLRVNLIAGTDGQALTHSCATAQTHLETACLIALGPDLAGPSVVLLRAFDAQGEESVRLTIQPQTRTASIAVTDSSSSNTLLTAPIPEAPAWTAIHTVIADSPTPQLTLSMNGLPVASTALPASPRATLTVQLGACLKHHDTAGTLDLDQVKLNQSTLDDPLPLPPLECDHAGDPARWLVIYNTSLPDSVSWAEHYRGARHIPHCNLVGLPLPTTPSMTPAEYESLRSTVVTYLETNRLRDRILSILTGFGVPPIMQFDVTGFPMPVANLLATDAQDFSLAANPAHTPQNADGTPSAILPRPTPETLTAGNPANPPARLCASIDAPDLTQAIAITTRATNIAATGLHANTSDTLYIDPYPDPLGTDPLYQSQLIRYAQSNDAAALRLPISLAQPPDEGQPANRFTQLTDDSIHLTLRADTPPADLFNTANASRVCSLALHLGPPALITSLRDPTATNWLHSPIAAGYAAALAPIENVSPDTRPHASTLIEALRLGYTLAEAFALA